MDFLDPRKRRAHHVRLMVGYVLVAIAVGLGAIILFYVASGYGINTKTGDIVQNGLLFADSKPGGADIYLNGKSQGSTTSARLILPAGNYKLTLKKAGYRNWERSFTLTEHSIARYVYPFLFPEKPVAKNLKLYPTSPPLISQSPDRRWLLVEIPPASGDTTINFDEYDTNDLTIPPKVISLPENVLTSPVGASDTLKEVEWSDDNKHVLLQHGYATGNEYLIFNRDVPADSINVNKIFNTSPSEVALRDKKVDQLYLFDEKTGNLNLGNTSAAVVTPVLKHVLAFKPSGPDLINYVSYENVTPGQVAARIWDGTKSYSLYTFKAGNKYLIDEAQFQGHWYYVAGSDMDERLNIYKDPLNTIKDPAIGKAIPMLSLNILGATKVSFSANTRFVEAQADSDFAVYDFEVQNIYHYSLKAPLADSLQWMDGHRLMGDSNDTVFVADYDSTNQQLLVPTNYPHGGFFDRDYNHLLTTADVSGGVELQSMDTRAGVDLPKNGQ